jgi:hypothetical protein
MATYYACVAVEQALTAAAFVRFHTERSRCRFAIREVTRHSVLARDARTGVSNDPDEQTWRITRWAGYVSGEVPMPVAPTTPQEFEFYLSHKERFIQGEAILCVTALGPHGREYLRDGARAMQMDRLHRRNHPRLLS